MKFIIASLIVSILVYFGGGWLSSWTVTEDARAAWIIVSALCGAFAALSLIGNE